MGRVDRGPDLICFGMQRAGTRWLYDQLACHPGAWMPPVKEIGHFNDKPFKPTNRPDKRKYAALDHQQLTEDEREAFFRDFTPERRAPDPDRWYLDLFAAKNERISGDISPEYAALRGENIRSVIALCPNAHFLLLIRDPVERFWSAANLHVRANHYEPQRLHSWDGLSVMLARSVHRRRSYPSRIWGHWRKAGPDARMQFVFYDQIRDRPAAARAEIFSAIGLDPSLAPLAPDFDRKAGQRKLPMPPAIRKRLTHYFMPEYEACAEAFGGYAVEWLAAARARMERAPAG